MRTALLIASGLTVLTTTALLVLAIGERVEQTERHERAAAYTDRAAALAADGDYTAAALAHRRAARLAPDLGAADDALRAAHRADALAVITRDALPAPADRVRLAALTDALAAGPARDDQTTAALLRAVVQRLDGNLDAAATTLTDARGAADLDPWIDWQLGAIRLRQARTADAITALEALARARPGFAAGFHRLGLAYLAADRPEGAIGALQKAIDTGGPPDASLDLARLYLGREMWAEAIPHLERVLRGRGGDVDALRLLAAAHFRLGRHDLAARTYRQAHQLDRDPRTLLSAAIALAAGGKQGEALAALDTLVPRLAELPEIGWQRARILTDLGRTTEARAALRAYLAAAAGHPAEADRVADARRLLGEAPTPADPPAAPTQPAAPRPGTVPADPPAPRAKPRRPASPAILEPF